MIPFYFTGSILIMLIIWAVYVLIYSGIIRKMGAEPGFGLVPLAAEWRMSKVLFASMRSFYQPVLSSIVFLAASRYVGAQSIFSIIFWMAGLLVYSVFLMRLSWRISQAFNMGILFGILTIFFPGRLSALSGLWQGAVYGAQFPDQAVAQDCADPLKRHGFPVFGGGVPGTGICRRPVVNQGEYAPTRCGIPDQRQQ